jgi:hypothetical protein
MALLLPGPSCRSRIALGRYKGTVWQPPSFALERLGLRLERGEREVVYRELLLFQ